MSTPTFEQQNLMDVPRFTLKICEKPFVGGHDYFEG